MIATRVDVSNEEQHQLQAKGHLLTLLKHAMYDVSARERPTGYSGLMIDMYSRRREIAYLCFL